MNNQNKEVKLDSNLVLSTLANTIIERLKPIILIENDMKKFMDSQISEDMKKKVLNLLYQVQLYSRAYIGPDPRGRFSMFNSVFEILNSKTDDEVTNNIPDVESTIKYLKVLEENPISQIAQKLIDKEKYEGVRF